ncbi:hypothetical protein PSN45_005336 [Yamadazyma tenuis]|uniref:CFEM-domain-containing protein n=1 Tax=Candida tenuis (strain ATCC 10573 / BCRC 21748 / CBS 615 / JCM 9827 / NBRC 10315 / NRRL Y-1498 / VKM Y-70) TaxID=590646 RepID=G3B1I7_CANTC|nr:CFEM-domain-containing protein [Yamadazyma tenuis ATCC 10573]XP_006686006.1 uncharacterized protein CANTEDRAFT_113728 [Yamadazyma tenuis ATCC 10573]EGV65199.1 CFEM-domain-containing protein [Yamadazyma tenuis ATCC 10573]EGV65200.1 hypothetical protein CANTEDRAFT_113728 [Yamadazyma tenuis ATCC 10573]WEJ97775.1 hypothetical protein PSN45_005336 [Yamadazyma tenuis]
MVSFNALAVIALGSITSAATITTTNYATYPSVAHTASINGFADRIYADLPSCAQPCVKEDTGITPCPYWDTGCLCVMQNWDDRVANCVASACSGAQVATVTSLVTSLCSSAGVPSPYWFVGTAASNSLVTAAAAA